MVDGIAVAARRVGWSQAMLLGGFAPGVEGGCRFGIVRIATNAPLLRRSHTRCGGSAFPGSPSVWLRVRSWRRQTLRPKGATWMFCFAALVNVVVFPFVAGGRRGSVGRLVAGALSGAALARLGDVVARHLDAISFSSRLCCGGAAEGPRFRGLLRGWGGRARLRGLLSWRAGLCLVEYVA